MMGSHGKDLDEHLSEYRVSYFYHTAVIMWNDEHTLTRCSYLSHGVGSSPKYKLCNLQPQG